MDTVTHDLEEIRAASGTGFRKTVARLLQKRCAAMLLLDVEVLRRLGKLPRHDEVEDQLVSYSNVEDDDCE